MCNGITIGGNVSIQISGPCATNGGGALFDNVILTAGTQYGVGGAWIDITIEVLKSGTRINAPCVVWLIDSNVANWSADVPVGGQLFGLGAGVKMLIIDAGYFSATLVCSEVPSTASIFFVLSNGALTTPVAIEWAEV